MAASFVLVHGGWHGGWCWSRVTARLRGQGHLVFAPSLTGSGERAHLMSNEITLETGIQDVLGVFEAEELSSVTLVGHSAGAATVLGLADRIPERISSVLLVDGMLLKDGESLRTYFTPPQEVAYQAALRAGGVPFPPPPAEIFSIVPGPDTDWVNRRLTPQPFGVAADPLNLENALGNGLPCTYIACIAPVHPFVARSHEIARNEPGWEWNELKTGHDAMITAPSALAELLENLA